MSQEEMETLVAAEEAEVATENVTDETAPEAAEEAPQDVGAAMFGDLALDEAKEDDAAAEDDEAAEDDAADGDEGGEAEEDKHAEADEYALPEGLGKKAQERFQKLANENKQYRALENEWREVSESVTEFRHMMTESCNNTDEVLQLFDYARAVKNGDWQTAEKYLKEQVLQFEMVAGKRLDIDALAQFGDIKERLDNMDLDEAGARELAQARYLRDKQQQALQAQQAQQSAQQAFEQQRQAAMQEVNAMSNEWAKSDLRWAEREAAMVEFIRSDLVHRHPNEWVNGLRWYYEGLKKMGNAPQKVTTPLRAAPIQHGRQEAASVADAMFGDLN